MRSRLLILAATAACTSSSAPVGPGSTPGPVAPAERAYDGSGSSAAIVDTTTIVPRWLLAARHEGPLEESRVLVRIGADTLSLEHYSRLGGTISSRLEKPGERVDLTIALEPDGSARRMEARVTTAGETRPWQRFWATFEGDSISSRTLKGTELLRGGGTLPPRTLPYFDPSTAMLEIIVQQARRSGEREVSLPVLVLGSESVVVTSLVRFVGADSAQVVFGETVTHLRIDERGRILGGSVPSVGATIERLPSPVPSRVAITSKHEMP